jgi:hypothetical protein
MNGSEINKILNGLYSGGVGLAAGLIDKSEKNKPKEYYDKEKKYLADTYQGSIDAANNILNPPPVQQTPMQDPVTEGRRPPVTDPTQSGIPGGEQPTDPVQTKQPLNINDLYARRESAIMDLQGMKYGAPYAESLNRLYKDTLDPQSDWEIKEGKDGQFLAINKKTFETKNITEPVAKEKEFSTKGWGIFLDESGKPYYGERVNKNGTVEIEFRDNLNAQELKDYQYVEDLKAKKLAPPVRTGRRTGGPRKVSAPKSPQTGADIMLQGKVKKYADLKVKDWESMTPEEQDEYQALNGEINRLTGLDADDVTNDLMNSGNMQESMSDLRGQDTEIMNNLEQIMQQYQSGEYDNEDLEALAYEWLGSLFNSGIDQAVLDKAYDTFNQFIFNQKGGTITP